MNAPVEQRLQQLPELDPPVDAWQRIRRAARREVWHARWHRSWPLLLAGSLTATAAGLVLAILVPDAPDPAATAPVSTLIVAQAPELGRLQAQSRHLEAMLRGLPGRPELVRAENAAAIAALEDRIAQLDWALSRSSTRPGPANVQPVLWRERVGLMGELVRARYTEAGVAAY